MPSDLPDRTFADPAPARKTDSCAAREKASRRRPNVRVVVGDITELDVECFVHYADADLRLNSGFGSMIARRGGPSIQKELNRRKKMGVGSAVATSGGKLRARFIVHVVGPAFQEEAIEEKLLRSVLSALRLADERGARRIALPPMGTGFHGIRADVSARVMREALDTFAPRSVEEMIVCVGDPWITGPYERIFECAKGSE